MKSDDHDHKAAEADKKAEAAEHKAEVAAEKKADAAEHKAEAAHKADHSEKQDVLDDLVTFDWEAIKKWVRHEIELAARGHSQKERAKLNR